MSPYATATKLPLTPLTPEPTKMIKPQLEVDLSADTPVKKPMQLEATGAPNNENLSSGEVDHRGSVNSKDDTTPSSPS